MKEPPAIRTLTNSLWIEYDGPEEEEQSPTRIATTLF